MTVRHPEGFVPTGRKSAPGPCAYCGRAGSMEIVSEPGSVETTRMRLCDSCWPDYDAWLTEKDRQAEAWDAAHARPEPRRERRREFRRQRGGAAPVSGPADDARHNGRGSLAEAFDAL